MLTVKTVPVLMRMIAKLDIKPVINTLKEADIFKNAENKQEALAQLQGDAALELGTELIAEIAPQLDKIADDIPVFVALYKDMSLTEAGKLDFAEVLCDIRNDKDIINFFFKALRKKVEQDV